MRILLIATNRHTRWMSRDEVRPMPIGLAYIASYIDPRRHQLKVLDLMFSDDYLAETEAIAQEFQPEVVGVSLRNLDNGSYVNPQSALPITREVIERIRSCCKTTIVCGGPAFSVLPQECFQYLDADIGLTGDAGESFALLVKRLAKGKPYNDVAGLVYRDKGEIKVSPAKPSATLSRPPRLKQLDLGRYRKAGFGIGVITKLGKPEPSSTATEPEYRVIRSVNEVIAELQRLQDKHGLREFFFIDTAFNRPMDYAKELCHRIIGESMDIKWNTNLHPNGCDQELLSLMAQAGCQMAIINGATVSEPGLHQPTDAVKLATDLVHLQQLCELCQSAGIPFAITQGFGELGESEQTVRTKLAFLSSLTVSEGAAYVTLRVGIRILPGSPLADQARYEEAIENDKDLLMPVFYIARPVRATLLDTLQAAVASNPSWNLM